MYKSILLTICLLLYCCKYSQQNKFQTTRSNTIISSEKPVNNKLSSTDDCNPKENVVLSAFSSRRLSEYPDDYLIYLSKDELRKLRNYFYASKGYRFKSSDLAEYFGSQPWYCPKYDNVDSLISPIEKANIDVIIEAEKQNLSNSTDRFNYFLGLFSPKRHSNMIPIYYLKDYLKFEDYLDIRKGYDAIMLVHQFSNYFSFILNVYDWGVSNTEIYYLVTMDYNGSLIDMQTIGNDNEKINEREIVSIFTKWDDDTDRTDTIRISYFYTNDFGKIIIKQK